MARPARKESRRDTIRRLATTIPKPEKPKKRFAIIKTDTFSVYREQIRKKRATTIRDSAGKLVDWQKGAIGRKEQARLRYIIPKLQGNEIPDLDPNVTRAVRFRSGTIRKARKDKPPKQLHQVQMQANTIYIMDRWTGKEIGYKTSEPILGYSTLRGSAKEKKRQAEGTLHSKFCDAFGLDYHAKFRLAYQERGRVGDDPEVTYISYHFPGSRDNPHEFHSRPTFVLGDSRPSRAVS